MSDQSELKLPGGLGNLFFALVLWALSIGASGWLGFYLAVHSAAMQTAADKRVAVAVGEAEKPTSRYIITLDQRYFHIDSARWDGHSLELYYRNNSHVRLYNYCFQYRQKGADGTIIASSSSCFPGDDKALRPGERAELVENIEADTRTTSLTVGFDAPLRGE